VGLERKNSFVLGDKRFDVMLAQGVPGIADDFPNLPLFSDYLD
jgi:hypothetical protein